MVSHPGRKRAGSGTEKRAGFILLLDQVTSPKATEEARSEATSLDSGQGQRYPIQSWNNRSANSFFPLPQPSRVPTHSPHLLLLKPGGTRTKRTDRSSAGTTLK